jgi:hypothetical protein
LKLVKYDGTAKGYLLILTNKKRPGGTLRSADEVPVAALYLPKGELIAVSDQDFEILNEQGHIAKDRLQQVPESQSPDFQGFKGGFRLSSDS